MSRRSLATRRELDQHHFPFLVLLGVPLLALFLYSYLPRILPFGHLLDLPLLVVLYFSFSRRGAIGGTLMGTLVGLLEDTMGSQYLGVHGIAKATIGFLAASVGSKVDVDNFVTRGLMAFGASILQSLVLFGTERFLLGTSTGSVHWVPELVRAAVNVVVGVPLFAVLDLLRQDD